MIIFTDIIKLLQQEEKGFLSSLKAEDELFIFVEKDKSNNMCVPVSMVTSLRDTVANVEFLPMDENVAYHISYKLGFLTNLSHLPFEGCIIPVTICLNEDSMKLVLPLKQVFAKSCFNLSFIKKLQGKETIPEKDTKPKTPRKKVSKIQQVSNAGNDIEAETGNIISQTQENLFSEKVRSVLKEKNINPGNLLPKILADPQKSVKLKECITQSSDANIGLPTLLSVYFGKDNSSELAEVIKNAGYIELKELAVSL